MSVLQTLIDRHGAEFTANEAVNRALAAELRELAARHLDVHLVGLHVQKRRKHGRDAARTDRPPLVISEAQVRAELAKMSGRQFDPRIVEAATQVLMDKKPGTWASLKNLLFRH